MRIGFIVSLVEYPPAERWAEGRWAWNVRVCLYCVSSACVLACEPRSFMPVEGGGGRGIAVRVAPRCARTVRVHGREREVEIFFFLYTLDVYV